MIPEIRLAGCVIQDDQGRLLLLHRNTPRLRQWEIPGGKLDRGEDPKTTAKRELREEMGIDVTLERHLGSASFVEDGRTMVYTWFLAKIVSGSPQAMETDKHDKVAFLDLEDLNGMASEISPNIRNLVREIAAGRIKL